MKQNVLALTLAALCGALLLHCGGGAVNDLLDGSFVDDASGQPTECCESAAPEFTVIAETGLTAASPSAEFDLRGYREVIVYATGDLSSTQLCTFAEVRFRASSSVPYGMTASPDLLLFYYGAGSELPTPGARMRVDGTHMQITGVGCNTLPRKIVVAGVR